MKIVVLNHCSSTLCRGKNEAALISLLCGSGNSAVSVVGSFFFEMCDDDVETSDEKKIVIGDHINDRRRFL